MQRSRKQLTAGRLTAWTVLLGTILGFCILLGASFGASETRITNLLPWGGEIESAEKTILIEVRLPRVLLAAVLGGSLSVAGVVFQALLRNPLADPYVLGVSGGASIGRVVAVLLGFGAAGGIAGNAGVPVLAFLGALGSLLLIEWIATVDGRLTVYTILLTGVIFNAFSGALIYFLQSIASLEQLHSIVFSLMGRVPRYGYAALGVFGAVSLAATIALFAMSRNYNALTLGEEGATQLGVDVERVKRATFVLGSLLTGMAVSIAGLIGFIGLVVPHILRLLLGPDHRILLPTAFLGGASFLVLADLAARTLIAPGEIPVGVVTALVGGPFFLYLLRRRRTSYELS